MGLCFELFCLYLGSLMEGLLEIEGCNSTCPVPSGSVVIFEGCEKINQTPIADLQLNLSNFVILV